MKKILKSVFGAMLCMGLISSCGMIDFSEDCSYKGDVKIIFDWQCLPEGDEKPDIMQTTFYPDNGLLSSYQLAGDTILTGLAATRHEVLSFNQLKGISFHETDCHCTAYAEIETYTKDGKIYVDNAPDLYAAKQSIQIPAFGNVECILTPRPCYQQVFVDFVIIRNNVDAEIESLSGELSGVATMYSFGEMEAMQSDAFLPFEGKLVTEDKYHTAMQMLGLHPSVSNYLDIYLSLTDDKGYSQSLDLTGVFKNFTARQMYLTIEIRLSNLGISLSIADWYTGGGGNIEI